MFPNTAFVAGAVAEAVVAGEVVVSGEVVVAGAVVAGAKVGGAKVGGSVVTVNPKLCKQHGCDEYAAIDSYGENLYFDYCLKHQGGCCNIINGKRCNNKDPSYRLNGTRPKTTIGVVCANGLLMVMDDSI